MAPAAVMLKTLATAAGPFQLFLMAVQTRFVIGRGKRGTAEVKVACGQEMAAIKWDED